MQDPMYMLSVNNAEIMLAPTAITCLLRVNATCGTLNASRILCTGAKVTLYRLSKEHISRPLIFILKCVLITQGED